MKRLLFILPIIAFAGLAAFLGYGLTQDPKELPSQLIDRPLPEFALPGIDPGAGLASASFRGEPRLLNVWASWCSACPQEHPVLTQIAREGFVVTGIAWKDKPEDSRAFLARFGNPYQALGSDLSGRTAIDLGVTGAPETFIIDKQGRVRFKVVGPISPEAWEGQIKPLMQQLRAEA
ncbi:MAG: DsbE family thiol:disulfide interchange protein [Sphingomonadales bacterium]|jgi:cytochrome c biogenesis protein CcmG/thiol:disulfide interchange protein DsbE